MALIFRWGESYPNEMLDQVDPYCAQRNAKFWQHILVLNLAIVDLHLRSSIFFHSLIRILLGISPISTAINLMHRERTGGWGCAEGAQHRVVRI